jgi:hypothetical protein
MSSDLWRVFSFYLCVNVLSFDCIRFANSWIECRQTPVVEASLHYGAGKNLWFDKLTILSEIEGKLSAVWLPACGGKMRCAP